MKHRLPTHAVVCTLALTALCAGCQESPDRHPQTSATQTATPEKVRLALNWFPEAEHGGFYAAQVHGYYEQVGLDVDIVPGGPNAPVIQEVVTGRVEFGITNADHILLGRAAGAAVVALMAPLQNSPRCIMVHEKSNIKKLEDLTDMTLAMNVGKPFAMFLHKRLPLTNVEFVPYPGNVAEFLTRDDFAQQAYVFSEPFVARKKGGDPMSLMVSDLGFNPYTSVLFTLDETASVSPDLVQRFTGASVRGWQTYLDSPERTNQRINELNPAMDMDILKFGADTMRTLCLPDANPKALGQMTAGRWITLAKQLTEIGALDTDQQISASAWTARYLITEPAEPNPRE